MHFAARVDAGRGPDQHAFRQQNRHAWTVIGAQRAHDCDSVERPRIDIAAVFAATVATTSSTIAARTFFEQRSAVVPEPRCQPSIGSGFGRDPLSGREALRTLLAALDTEQFCANLLVGAWGRERPRTLKSVKD